MMMMFENVVPALLNSMFSLVPAFFEITFQTSSFSFLFRLVRRMMMMMMMMIENVVPALLNSMFSLVPAFFEITFQTSSFSFLFRLVRRMMMMMFENVVPALLKKAWDDTK